MKVEEKIIVVITAEIPQETVDEIRELQMDHSLDDAQFLIEATKSLTVTMNRRFAAMQAREAKNGAEPKKRGPKPKIKPKE